MRIWSNVCSAYTGLNSGRLSGSILLQSGRINPEGRKGRRPKLGKFQSTPHQIRDAFPASFSDERLARSSRVLSQKPAIALTVPYNFYGTSGCFAISTLPLSHIFDKNVLMRWGKKKRCIFFNIYLFRLQLPFRTDFVLFCIFLHKKWA